MVAFKGHFDGRVIVPREHLDLPRDRELLFQVETAPKLVSGRELLKHAGRLDERTAREMEEAIRDCERSDGCSGAVDGVEGGKVLSYFTQALASRE